MSGEILTHWRQTVNPDYLGAYSLAPKYDDVILTIAAVKQNVEVHDPNGKKENKTVAYFAENVKPMILNSTNMRTIVKLSKSEFIERWVGLKIQVYKATVKAFGDMHDCLRIRPFKPKTTKPELLPNTETWNAAISHMAESGFTIDKVMGKYTLSEENKVKLIEEAAQKKVEIDSKGESESE